MASLVASNWRKIVRLYEGYPYARLYRYVARERDLDQWFVAKKFPGSAYHLARQKGMEPRRAYRRYPPSDFEHEVLPTSLGNILLSAERYGLQRYGIDVTLLWPRFYWQLPPEMRKDLEAFKEEHQLPLALSFMSAIFGFLAGGIVLVSGGSWLLFAGASASGVVLAAAAYLLALERAEEYGEQIRAAVDLHHRSLFGIWDEPADLTNGSSSIASSTSLQMASSGNRCRRARSLVVIR